MKRKYIVVVVIVFIVAFLAYLFFRQVGGSGISNPSQEIGSLPVVSGTNNTGDSTTGISSGASIPGAGVLHIIDNGPVVAYVVDPSGVTTLVRPDGTISTILAGGQAQVLSTSSISNLISAQFSYNAQKILFSSGDVKNPQTSIFDITSRAWTPLSMGILSPVWSPSDYRIAYMKDNGSGAESLFTLDAGKLGQASVNLGTFYVQDMSLAWPISGTVILASRPSAYVSGSAFSFDFSKKALVPFIENRMGFDATWDHTASSTTMALAFFAGQGARGGTLQLITMAGVTAQNLSFITIPSKCVFAEGMLPTSLVSSTVATTTSVTISSSSFSTYLYCAVPRDQASLAYYPLPDGYAQDSVVTADNIYRINPVSGVTDSLFADPSQSFDVTIPQVYNNTFYFINRYDQKLYSVSLP